MPRTKIVCTIGPATDSPEKMRALMHAGMNVARINFSHGDHASHSESIATLRKVPTHERCLVAIIADLQGPKLRVGDIESEAMELHTGTVVTLSPETHSSREDEIPVPRPQLLRDLNAGQTLLLDDGHLSLTIEARGDGGSLKARIQTCNRVGKLVITATQML